MDVEEDGAGILLFAGSTQFVSLNNADTADDASKAVERNARKRISMAVCESIALSAEDVVRLGSLEHGDQGLIVHISVSSSSKRKRIRRTRRERRLRSINRY